MNEEWDRVAPIAFMLPPANQKNAVKSLKQAYLKDKPLVNNEETADGLGKLYGDSIIGFSVHRWELLINILSNLKLPRGMYSLFCKSVLFSQQWCHGCDAKFV